MSSLVSKGAFLGPNKNHLSLANNGWNLNPCRQNINAHLKDEPKRIGRRDVFEGILWLLWTGAKWNHLANR